MIILGGSSRQSLAELRDLLDKKIKGLTAADCSAVSKDLFAAVLAIDSSIGLRRALTDPARDGASKAELISNLFKDFTNGPALSLLSSAVEFRWSSPAELADALEQIAVEAEASAANIENQLDRLQSEIFEFSRLLIENPQLRQALSTDEDTVQNKQSLIKSIFGSKFSVFTNSLLLHSVEGRRSRSIEKTISSYAYGLTARRNRVNAHIRVSIALTDFQKKKLTDSLTKQIGQPVHLNIEIDPSVIGGVSIRFGDEVIDGTISKRLAEASQALVS